MKETGKREGVRPCLDPLLKDESRNEGSWPKIFSAAFKRDVILLFQFLKYKLRLTDAVVLREREAMSSHTDPAQCQWALHECPEPSFFLSWVNLSLKSHFRTLKGQLLL